MEQETKDIVNDIVNDIEIDNLINDITKNICGELDEYVATVYDVLHNQDERQLTEAELDNIVMKLPCMMYFVGEKQEQLGLRDDILKYANKEEYAKIMQREGKKTENEMQANIELRQKQIISSIITRSYKQLSVKMDMALELMQSAKKVLSRRMALMELENSSEGVGNGR